MDISLSLNAERARTGEDLASRWGPAAIAVCGAFMTAIGWMKWGDLMVDYGSQVYLPWQIAEGKVLYRDIHYLFGPLSSHVHALLFSIFGPGIQVLVVFNLLLAGVLAGLLFVMFRRSADALTATLCGISFVVVFALGQYRGSGNFNFAAPYNYELTHGVLLGIVTLFLYQSYLHRAATGKLVALGLLTGLVFLTKPEAFLALFTAMAVGMPLAVHYQGGPLRTKLFKMGLWALALISLPVVFWMYLALHMPAGAALQGLTGPFLHVWDPGIRSFPLYRWVQGMNAPGGNLLKLFGYALAWALVLGLIYAVQRMLAGKPDNPFSRAGGGWALVLVLSVLIGLSPVPWMELVRPLPLFVLGYGLYQIRNLRRAAVPQKAPPLFLLVFSLFSLVLMFKILFNVHVFHYGFALAFPAFMLFIRFLVHDWPRHAPSGQESFPFVRAMAAALVLVFVLVQGHLSYKLYMLKNYKVGSGRDTMREYHPSLTQRGPIVNAALEFIHHEIDPKEAFPVLPGGSMLNYLSRHPNPFPFLTFDPLEMHVQGETRYLERFQAQPPRYIVFVARDYLLLGAQYFGEGYAENLYTWISTHYEEMKRFGKSPFSREEGYGILFLQHRNWDVASNAPLS